MEPQHTPCATQPYFLCTSLQNLRETGYVLCIPWYSIMLLNSSAVNRSSGVVRIECLPIPPTSRLSVISYFEFDLEIMSTYNNV